MLLWCTLYWFSCVHWTLWSSTQSLIKFCWNSSGRGVEGSRVLLEQGGGKSSPWSVQRETPAWHCWDITAAQHSAVQGHNSSAVQGVEPTQLNSPESRAEQWRRETRGSGGTLAGPASASASASTLAGQASSRYITSTSRPGHFNLSNNSIAFHFNTFTICYI